MENQIPQPPSTFLIGNLRDVNPDCFIASLQRLQKLYGPIFSLDFFQDHVIVISSQEIVNYVCDESKFDKTVRLVLTEIKSVGGDGLFTAETAEPNWNLAHKILMPAFGPTAIRGMFPAMMDIASQLILRWERFAGEEIDICDSFTRLTLDTIALCSFNYRFNSFYQNTKHKFVEAMINVLIESNRRSQRLTIQNKLMVSTNRKYYDDIAYANKLCDEIVQERRKNPTEINDLLNRMIHGKDPDTGYQLSDENIRYQMITFLIAGHETTSGLLSFAFYYLLKNPICLQKARDEADQYDEITLDTLTKLKYIDAVLKETLRLQPTAPAYLLKCKNDEEVLPGGYRVREKDIIFVLLPGLHRDPKIWERPEEFLPERMLNGGFENLPPNAWKPFGNGQRACIGRPFAWQEALLAVALILKHFHIELADPSYDLRIKETLTMKPEGFHVRVRSRKHFTVGLNALNKVPNEKSSGILQQPTNMNNLRPISILYGSNSGSCESFARTIASEVIIYGYNAKVATLDSMVGRLPNDCPIVIITASYEGKPCDNAKQFVVFLESKPNLMNVNYAVFGAGHRDWVNTYQKIPKYIDHLIEIAGGKRIIDRGEGDAAGDFYGSFDAWKENLFRALQKENPSNKYTDEEKLSIKIVSSSRNLGHVNETGSVVENKCLVESSEIGPMIRHLEIQLPQGQTYRSGDYLAVLPTNPIEMVTRVLKKFHLTTDTYVEIQSKTETFLPTNRPVSAFDILSGYVELNQPISRKQLEILTESSTNEEEKIKIQDLLNDKYETEILTKRISILDMLEKYSSCEITFAQYLRMLPCLRVRQYSISSSPLWKSESVTLTFDVLQAPALSGFGQYYGVASNYLANLKKGDRISCSVRASNVRFHPPEDTKIPIVMIAAGTGIAPFRAFIQERAAQIVCGREVGRTILYFGCRSKDDFLYSTELDRWSKLDQIQIKTIFSRNGNSDRKYVQHLLWEDRKDIEELYQNGCYFYTCGSASKLGISVKQCFIKILSEIHQCHEEEAAKILDQISQDRFSVDVFT